MKRRLDLALALVHRPRILFLDEPTTGLDPQSRTALWEEVARLAHDEGMTVFLTTQYLEEADVLADRVGIIDHGKIVAEGTPARAQGRDRQPDRRGRRRPSPTRGDRLAELLSRFGELRRNGRGSVTVQLPGGEAELAEIVRVLDQRRAARRRRCSCTSRRWTTCSWPRPAASSRAPATAEDRDAAAERAGAAERRGR